MMLRVVTIDDEPLVRNRLRSLLAWEKHGYLLCGEASDGTEGLQMIEELRPHIAIVDMNMPGADGVEVVRRAKEGELPIQIIALSSYDSYDYVRGSLQHGAIDYLLKHRLDADSLLAVLGNARQRIEEEARSRTERMREIRQWEKMSPAISQTYIKELILGVDHEPELYREHFRTMPYGRDDQTHVLVLLRILNFEMLQARMQESQLAAYIRTALDLCGQAVGDAGCGVYLEQGTFGLLLSLEAQKSEYAMQQWAAARVSRVEKAMELYLNAVVVSETSRPMRSLAELHRQYAERIAKLWNESVVSDRTGEDASPSSASITIRQEKELLAAVEAFDAKAVAEIVRGIGSGLQRSGSSSGRSVARMEAELMRLAAKIAVKSGIQADWIYREMAAGQRRERSLTEAEEALTAVFNKLVQEIRTSKVANAYSRYVAQAVEAIHAEYKQGITLEEMAERLRITPAYLSRLFKEETGRTFTDYLTGYRVERSQQLIRTRAATIKEIYAEVGFNNYSYFIKVFKQHTGETPAVYAKRYGR